ncbi:MAG TPA: YlxR family protein [Thermoleophilia bacterium]|nr:YlxR family protein [Thermoleophilia bacterium]
MTGTVQTAVPRRTCVGCRRVAPSADLVRLTLRDGNVVLAARRPVGRGAWLCPEPACLEQAERRRAIDRALRARVSIDDDLRRRFTSVCEQRKAVM